MTTKNIIEISNVIKRYGTVTALDNVSLIIQQGEFFSLLGPSGCGKTTLLRAIAGFNDPDEGSLFVDGQDMHDVPANLRPTNMVFQSYAIFPHLNVEKNVAYGLRRLKLPAQEQSARVQEALAMVDLAGYGDRKGDELSGGQRQRVALARALVLRPKVLLLDEPLSALDKKLREQMQLELRQLQRAVGITFILVTHDQEEALTMSDRIAVMFDGQVSQVATPKQLYERPVNRQVAGFIGGMNFIDVNKSSQARGSLMLDTQGLGTLKVAAADSPKSDTFVIGIRPERFSLSAKKPARGLAVQAKISEIAYYGEGTYFYVSVVGRGEPIMVSASNTASSATLGTGDKAWLSWPAEAVVLLE